MKWGNCLFESIKAFLKNPKNIVVYQKGGWRLLKRKTFPHFYWYDKKEEKYFHFNAKYSDEPFLYQLWFEGQVDEFYYHRSEK